MLDQSTQHRELARRQVDQTSLRADLVGGQVDLELAEAELLEPVGRRRAPEDSLHAGDHLRRRGGLDDVVVTAETKPADLVRVAVAGAQEEHRHGSNPGAVGDRSRSPTRREASRPGAPGRDVRARSARSSRGRLRHAEPGSPRPPGNPASAPRSARRPRRPGSTRLCPQRRSRGSVSPKPGAGEVPATSVSSTFHRRLLWLLSGRVIIEAVSLLGRHRSRGLLLAPATGRADRPVAPRVRMRRLAGERRSATRLYHERIAEHLISVDGLPADEHPEDARVLTLRA